MCDFVLLAYTRLHLSTKFLNGKQISMVAKGIISNVSTVVTQGSHQVGLCTQSQMRTYLMYQTPKITVFDFPSKKKTVSKQFTYLLLYY